MLCAPRMCGILTTINMTLCSCTRGGNLGALETGQAHTATRLVGYRAKLCYCLRFGTLALVFSKTGNSTLKTQVPMV
jgi:hypothetical protein